MFVDWKAVLLPWQHSADAQLTLQDPRVTRPRGPPHQQQVVRRPSLPPPALHINTFRKQPGLLHVVSSRLRQGAHGGRGCTQEGEDRCSPCGLQMVSVRGHARPGGLSSSPSRAVGEGRSGDQAFLCSGGRYARPRCLKMSSSAAAGKKVFCNRVWALVLGLHYAAPLRPSLLGPGSPATHLLRVK